MLPSGRRPKRADVVEGEAEGDDEGAPHEGPAAAAGAAEVEGPEPPAAAAVAAPSAAAFEEGENIAPRARARSTSVTACLASPFSVPETKSMVSPK